VIVAFALQLDTAAIFRQLRNQPKLVEALVKTAPGVLEQGSAVQDPTDNSAYQTYVIWLSHHPLFSLKTLPTPPSFENYTSALAARIKGEPDDQYPINEFKKIMTDASTVNAAVKDPESNALRLAYDSWLQRFPRYKLEPPPDFATEKADSLTEKISAKVKTAVEAEKPVNTADWLAEYSRLQPEGVKAFQKAQAKTLDALRAQMEQAGFDLIPRPLFGRWDEEKLPAWTNWWAIGCIPRYFFHVGAHVLGIVVTASLLTLGAPFWFNLLKNLMSLRPAVATLIEKRPTSSPALPPAPATPPSPS
jgi:hypothetical protein